MQLRLQLHCPTLCAAPFSLQAASDAAAQLHSLMDSLTSQAAGAGGSDSKQGGDAPGLPAAAASLHQSLTVRPSGGSEAEGSSISAAQQLRQLASPALLQQAAALAAALAAQSEPSQEQQAADAVALARAVAAAPGCHNLACPNWTGEAERLKTCEACRTARYCSARCQRQAWRQGGHRPCCAALEAGRGGQQA